MQLRDIIKYDKVMELAYLLKDNGFDKYGFSIVTEVDTKEQLNKLNEDFFYKIPENKEKTPDYGDEISVNVGGIAFKYVIKENVENN